MARSSAISKEIYRRHIQLYRFLNDTYIFTSLMRPSIKLKLDKFSASLSKKKKSYPVPKRGNFVLSRRRDADIAKLLNYQYERGQFESLIVSIISMVESFIVDCLKIVITEYPEKLSLLIDDKMGVPLDLFLSLQSKNEVLEEMIRVRSENITFFPPGKYIDRLQKILTIEID